MTTCMSNRINGNQTNKQVNGRNEIVSKPNVLFLIKLCASGIFQETENSFDTNLTSHVF